MESDDAICVIKMYLRFFSRYTGASAAANAWDQQKDDRGFGGHFRELGKGTTPAEYN